MTEVNKIKENLIFIINDLEKRKDIAKHIPKNMMGFDDMIALYKEFAEDANEPLMAYECIISLISKIKCDLSGESAIKLIEIALIYGDCVDYAAVLEK